MCWRLFNDHNIFVNLLQIINLWIQFLFIWRFLLDSMHDELLFELFVTFLQLFTDSTKLWFRIKLNLKSYVSSIVCLLICWEASQYNKGVLDEMEEEEEGGIRKPRKRRRKRRGVKENEAIEEEREEKKKHEEEDIPDRHGKNQISGTNAGQCCQQRSQHS